MDLYDVRRLKAILLQAIERDGVAEVEAAPAPGCYARPGDAFAVGREAGGENGSGR